jgi:hypothetical protein
MLTSVGELDSFFSERFFRELNSEQNSEFFLLIKFREVIQRKIQRKPVVVDDERGDMSLDIIQNSEKNSGSFPLLKFRE